jgi:serine/threonine protein phosphatase PrpC
MAFEIDIGYASQAGRKPLNEDFAAAMLPEPAQAGMGAIAAVADGVSQGGMGREAAQTTVTSLVRDYYGTPETWDTTVALERIISAQNAWLAGVNRRRAPALGMSTLTALVLRGQGYAIAHVGDSRAYLLRDGEVRQLTQDHVVRHPDFSHQLLRAVGAEEQLVVDYCQGEVQLGDVFVLLTDGVHNQLPERQLRRLLQQQTSDSQALSQALVEQALARGSNDNATALVLRVLGLDEAGLHDARRQSELRPVLPRLKVGERVDGLVVTALVADNGINLVYQVRHPVTQALYALKTLHPARAHDREERAMLAHEAWLAQRLQSGPGAEHLVTLREARSLWPAGSAQAGAEPAGFYLLYDWHAGETLEQQLARHGRMGVAQVLGIATQAARALGLLHRQGVIHRDVKPANLHQGEDGVLRLLDLGVALSGREPEAARLLHAGTPSYINPEQWGFSLGGGDGPEQAPDARSDLYALGVTLYQLLTGKLPYGEVLPYQKGRYHRDPLPPSRHHPEVPIWLDHVLLKAVALDQRRRFETAEELLLALERGASRPLTAPAATPLIQRDPAALWKIGLAVSGLLNLMLVYWLLFLPR